MGYFNRHHGQNAVHVDVSADELRDWFVDEPTIEPTPFERALRDAPNIQGTNLVVVSDSAGVIATVLETGRGAVWRAVIERGDPPRTERAFAYDLLEWDEERSRPLRLVARRRDDASFVELDPDIVLDEVAAARRTRKVQRILV
jgi:hypothetical protein